MRAPTLRLVADDQDFDEEIEVDCFAGGGGASLGLEWATGQSPAVAINHDPEALAMHQANHPDCEHYVEDIRDVDPRAVCRGRRVGLAWFSPDCKEFSRAKGGPLVRRKEIRSLPWTIVHWARTVRPRVFCVENVVEILRWGPLNKHGRIIKRREGEEFASWWTSMEHLGYVGDMRVMKACDFGAPTSRSRLVIVFRCDGQPIVFPDPTHGPGRAFPYRTAAECIDFTRPCPSIFLTKDEAKTWAKEQGLDAAPKRPLADKTMKRIARGLRKYVLEAKRPFIVPVSHGEKGTNVRAPHDIDEPFRTITGANRGELSVVQPYVVRTAHGDVNRNGKRRGQGSHSLATPLGTVCAGGTDFALVAPTLIQTGYGERPGQAPRSLDIGVPLGTVVGCGQRHALVSAFLAKHFGDRETGGFAGGADATKPFGTVTTRDHHSLVTSNLVKLRGTTDGHMDASSIGTDQPVPTISAGGNHVGEVRAFLTKYFGQSDAANLNEPMGTLTTKERYGIVTVEGETYQIIDIGMRMLCARELFRAMGFPDSYVINPTVEKWITRGRKNPRRELIRYQLSTKAQVRMCGNAVCPDLAEAVARANYTPQRYAVEPLAAVA